MLATDWLAHLAASEAPAERVRILRELGAEQASAIQAKVVALLYTDAAAARRLVDAGHELAAMHPENVAAQAYAQRGIAHLAYSSGNPQEAAESYLEAIRLFSDAGLSVERARTQSSALQSLILLSRYEEAEQWAAEAERTFLQAGDLLRLARLDSNVGNIHFRQDRPWDAMARYKRALEGFRAVGDAKDIAAVLSNMAVTLTNLGDFGQALRRYREASEHCRTNGLLKLAAQADYNIAYLYYLRGDYREARRLYEISRRHCEEANDAYHLALCDLDEAEMSLELNLSLEGEALAKRAANRFDSLGFRYERAKALVNVAIGASQLAAYSSGDRILRQARELFALEKNALWPAYIDLLRANLAFRSGKFTPAKRLCNLAWKTLAQSAMPGRAAHCQLLRGRLHLNDGHYGRALAAAREVLQGLDDDSSPSLRFHACLLEGEANEQCGRWREALSSFEAARRELEELRGRLDTEDLRISMLNDKLAVYEGLIALHLESPLAVDPTSVEKALMLVQQAKSRSLADRLLQMDRDEQSKPEVESAESLRQDLNLCYRQIENMTFSAFEGTVATKLKGLRERAQRIEAKLLEHRFRHPSADPTGALFSPARTLKDLQGSLHDGTVLMEYFENRGRLYLFLISSKNLQLVRLGAMHGVRHSMKLLQFQLGKYRTQAHMEAFTMGVEAARNHLHSLWDLLIAPAYQHLAGFARWVVAPHRSLHGVPFAALKQDGNPLISQHEIVHTASASVYAACVSRPPVNATGAWVIGSSDSRSPQIEEEAANVAQLLPGSTLITGQAATVERFRQASAQCAVLHLAAHGIFRRDNPMFSSLQLSDGRFSLLDLARTRMNAALVTLSACNTGRGVPVGGDEILGLMRGFLAAGARSLLVSLWEIDDASTAEFMKIFYQNLGEGNSAAQSLRIATTVIREKRPHPYFWAPYVLIGT